MTDHSHDMPVNDVDHAWTEERTYATPDGVGRFIVFCGKCTCGKVFEARDSSSVTRAWMDHRGDK